jgi:hypothetical protein
VFDLEYSQPILGENPIQFIDRIGCLPKSFGVVEGGTDVTKRAPTDQREM